MQEKSPILVITNARDYKRSKLLFSLREDNENFVFYKFIFMRLVMLALASFQHLHEHEEIF